MEFSKSMALRWLFLFVALAFAIPSQARPEWALVSSSGGYLGTYGLGLVREVSPNHHLGFGVGLTRDPLLGDIRQLNLGYMYSPLRYRTGPWMIEPLAVGAFLTGTGRREYFVKSPDRYQDASYYDVTKVRMGTLFGFSLARQVSDGRSVSFDFFLSILDIGWQAAFNNKDFALLGDYLSTGFGLRFDL